MERNTIRQRILESIEPMANDPVSIVFNDQELESILGNLPKKYCIGNCSTFIFNFSTGKFLYLEPAIREVTGFDATEFIHLTVSEIFERLLHPDQAFITVNLHQEAYRALMSQFEGRMDVYVNMDYAIQTKSGAAKRLLSQFRPILWQDGSLILIGGHFTDISYLKKDGPPVVTFCTEGSILRTFNPQASVLVRKKLTEYTLRELEILRMTAAGSTTDEIAENIGVSKATVYAHRRNILAKSEYRSINKLIDSLRFKGVLN